ncbi:MAG: nucleotidyltransferase domain-containing protein [Candidatus Zixiibacteriota bacterium]
MPRKKKFVVEVEKAIERIVKRLITNYRPDRIILYGSFAYGKPSEDSDIDMLIIKNSKKRRLDRGVEVRRIADDFAKNYAFSPIVLTPAELKRRIELGDDFVLEILDRGTTLYDRQGLPKSRRMVPTRQN